MYTPFKGFFYRNRALYGLIFLCIFIFFMYFWKKFFSAKNGVMYNCLLCPYFPLKAGFHFSLTASRFLSETAFTLNFCERYLENSRVLLFSPWFTRILFGLGFRFLT